MINTHEGLLGQLNGPLIKVNLLPNTVKSKTIGQTGKRPNNQKLIKIAAKGSYSPTIPPKNDLFFSQITSKALKSPQMDFSQFPSFN